MTPAREAILGRLRGLAEPEGAEDAASSALRPTSYDDRALHFAAMLEAAGGRCRSVPDRAALEREIAALAPVAEARIVASALREVEGSVLGGGGPAVGAGGAALLDVSGVDDPHALAEVDVALLPGHFGVAENGAVWVNDHGLSQRALYFVPQHVVLVVPADALVDTLHDAYERIAFEGRDFGCFIAGPSKTADIEQALVIGAHGPRSLTVFLVGEPPRG